MSGIDKITGMSAQDAALWRGARDLGELTAQWLEGTHPAPLEATTR